MAPLRRGSRPGGSLRAILLADPGAYSLVSSFNDYLLPNYSASGHLHPVCGLEKRKYDHCDPSGRWGSSKKKLHFLILVPPLRSCVRLSQQLHISSSSEAGRLAQALCHAESGAGSTCSVKDDLPCTGQEGKGAARKEGRHLERVDTMCHQGPPRVPTSSPSQPGTEQERCEHPLPLQRPTNKPTRPGLPHKS